MQERIYNVHRPQSERRRYAPENLYKLKNVGFKMTTIQLETYVKEQFNMELYKFIKHKVEVENLYDYELAGILNVNGSFIGKLRKTFGMKKAAKFLRQFEQTYGAGAVKKFKKIIENPKNSLAGAARHFGFSREYARQVYEKIYGYPYTEAFQSKIELRKRKMLANRKKSKRLELLIKVKRKMESMGLTPHLRTREHPYEILTNGYKLLLKCASTPLMIGKKQYFRITNTTGASPDFDFIICVCRNNGESIHYIIPRHAMPKYRVYLLPEAKPGKSKYTRFKEAWHLIAHENQTKGEGIMKAKDSKQKKAAFSAVQPSNISGIRPGYINFGSHLDQKNSLSARVKAEIDRRCFSKQDLELK